VPVELAVSAVPETALAHVAVEPLDVLVLVPPLGVVVVLVAATVVPDPGRHCEYHALLYVHVYPETHVVGPEYPEPPH